MRKLLVNLFCAFLPSRRLRHAVRDSYAYGSGHYYSPIPSRQDVKNYKIKSLLGLPAKIPGVNLNEETQEKFLRQITAFEKECTFAKDDTDNRFYHLSNLMFSSGCAKTLHSMIRIIQPGKIIEIGSGFSTALMVDTNQTYQNNSIDITCIEPYPERLYKIFGNAMAKYINLHENKLQDVELTLFDQLNADDILFIDSSHVVKLNSDVNRIFFEILPRLKNGVIVHFHDIFYPFDYPVEWTEQKRWWNEAYILRAFLQYNNSFEIIFWGNYLSSTKLAHDSSDNSIWLKKRG